MKKKISKEFLKKYFNSVIPAIISSVVLGTFSIVDGLFIGNKIGDIGLSSINFAWPITAFIQAVGFGIGMGGSIAISIANGQNDKEKEKKILFNTYILLLFFSILIFVLIFPFKREILILFKASGDELDLADKYITIILYGTLFQVFGQGLVCLLRNYKYNLYTMISMSCGFIANLILDYCLIYVVDMSLSGAAIGTLVSQFITSMMCWIVLMFKKNRPIISFSFKYILNILKNAVSPLGLFFAPNLLLMFVNFEAKVYGGSEAVAAYTAVSYITFIIMRIVQGVGDGSQPLYSYYYGENNKNDELNTLFLSKSICFIVGIIATLVLELAYISLGNIFGLSEESKQIFYRCLIIMGSSSICVAIIKSSTSYLYAKEKNLYAFILVYGEIIIATVITFTFPLFMSTDGIWLSTPISQGIVSILGILFTILEARNNKTIEIKEVKA